MKYCTEKTFNEMVGRARNQFPSLPVGRIERHARAILAKRGISVGMPSADDIRREFVRNARRVIAIRLDDTPAEITRRLI